jgi:SNF2 family DNA or RNA helicase
MIDFDEERRLFIWRRPALTPAISEWVGWKRLPGQGNVYAAPAWVSSVLAVRPLPNGPLLWTDRAHAKREELTGSLQRVRVYLASKEANTSLRRGMPTERRPRVHQRNAIHALREMGWRALLADEMGLGKTSTALWAAHDARVDRILVVCPVSVKLNWQNEIRVTLGDAWITVVIDGTPKQRAAQLADAVHASRKGIKIATIINYDLLLHLTDDQLVYAAEFVKDGMLLFDEIHYVKSSTSKRTKLSQQIAKKALYVIGLSGTPIRNMADDIFTQANIIRPGIWSSLRDFSKRYLVIQSVAFGKRTVQKVVGTKNVDQLNAVLNTFLIQRKKEDAINLPPKIYTKPQLELDGATLALYTAMKKFAKIQLEAVLQADANMPLSDKPVTIFDPRAKSAVEAALRCEQIAQGFVGGIPEPVMMGLSDKVLVGAEKIPGRPRELVFPHSPKLVWLLETITSIVKQGGAPLVLSRFNAPMFWLAKTLSDAGIKSVVLHGELSATGKFDVVGAFQDKQTDVLIAQVKMAEGWNATRSQDVLFLGRDWSPAINAQGEDRTHRIGQTGAVNVQIPIVRNTIEAMIDARLAAKDADAQQALRHVTIEELMEAL